MKSIKVFLGTIVIMAISLSYDYSVFAAIIKKGEFFLNFNADKQIISLSANETKLSEILKVISEKSGMKITTYGKEDKVISANFENKPLDEVLKRIIRDNYILVYQGEKLQKVGLATQSKKDSSQIKEFLGRIMEDGDIIKMFFIPRDFTVESIADYIGERHKFLDYLAENFPQKEIQTQFSFQDFIGKDEITKIANRYPEIKIQEVSQGWNDQKGGFCVDPNKPLSEELIGLEKMELQSINQRLEHAQWLINNDSGTNEEIKEKNKQFLQSSQEYKTIFQEKGVLLYGIKATGKAEEIKQMRDDLSYVRLADPIYGGKLEELLGKNNLIHMIPIALSPYDNPVSELEKK